MKACYLNILETSAVTLTAATEDANFPLTRLYDRKIGEPFQTTAAITTTIKIDQGASPVAVDRLLVAGHNLSGVALTIKYSDDDITYTDAVAGWTQPDGGIIDKSWASAIHRYWEFTATTPASIPSICEVFLTSTWVWEKDADRKSSGPFDSIENMENDVTRTGKDRFLVNGPPKRHRVYGVLTASEQMKNKRYGEVLLTAIDQIRQTNGGDYSMLPNAQSTESELSILSMQILNGDPTLFVGG